MPAVIESTLYTSPGGAVVAGSTQQNSRDDLQLGYQVTLRSVHEGTTYSWSLSFASDSPGAVAPGFGGTESVSALLPPEGATSRDGKFNVDYEGTYLIRLTVDAGLSTEATSFIRCRVLTLFGALKLVAAGERRDEKGVIPVDATPEGWANDQNANFQRIALLLRRLSSSGRILYVDSNRGRDSANDQNDYDNVISIPGPEAARVDETGMRLRAMAHGDFSTVNEAITYANGAAARGEPAPSITEPYFVIVRAGLYIEDLNFSSFVHIIGEAALRPIDTNRREAGLAGMDVHPVVIRPALTGGVGTHRYNPLGPWNTQQLYLANLKLENNQNTTLPVLDIQGGQVHIDNCVLEQRGDAVNQGEALRCVVSNIAYAAQVFLVDSYVVSDASTTDRAALRFDATGGRLFLMDTFVDAQFAQGLVLNETLNELCSFRAVGGLTLIHGREAFKGYGDSMVFAGVEVVNTELTLPAINVTAFGNGAGSKAGDVLLTLENVTLGERVDFESAGAAGTTTVNYSGTTIRGALNGQRIRFPDAPGDLPDVFQPSQWSDSLRYVPDHADPLGGVAAAATIPVPNRLVATSVQGAIDTILLALFPEVGAPFYSLTSAYNGLSSLNPVTAGAGLGRLINALHGAVQVQGATYPVATDNQLKRGGLQVEGMVDIGGFINGGATDLVLDVGHSEIGLIPDYTGAGPFIGLGRARWANGVTQADRGFGSASIVAGISNSPSAPSSNAPYHLHLRTSNLRTSGTGKAGNVYMVAGAINDPLSLHPAGDVHIVGGWSSNPAGGNPGDVYVVPGTRHGQAVGGVTRFVGAGGGAAARLTSVNPYVGGVAGTLYVGTPVGVESFTFTGVETLAGATILINTTARNVLASNDGTRLILSSGEGPYGDIRVVGDSTGTLALDTAFGTLTALSPGFYGDQVAVDVPINNTLRVIGNVIVTGGITVGADIRYIGVSTPWAASDPESTFSAKLIALTDINITLDAAMATSRKLTVVDQNGIAAPAQRIVVTDAAGGTFNGNPSLIINTNYGTATFFKNDAGNWTLI